MRMIYPLLTMSMKSRRGNNLNEIISCVIKKIVFTQLHGGEGFGSFCNGREIIRRKVRRHQVRRIREAAC